MFLLLQSRLVKSIYAAFVPYVPYVAKTPIWLIFVWKPLTSADEQRQKNIPSLKNARTYQNSAIAAF
jgi:hypothetical protein